MHIRSFAVLGIVILSGLLIGLAVLIHQNLQITASIAVQDQALSQLQDDVDSIQAKLAEFDRQFARIEQAAKTEEKNKTAPKPFKINLPSQGLYVLPAEVVGQKNGVGRKVTIYDVGVTVRINNFSQQIHVGAATSGLMSIPRVYIDYDGDGRVDMDMVRKFAEPLLNFLPGAGWLLSDSIDPDNSQEIYSLFLRNSDDAEFIPLDRISEDGGKMAQQLWQSIDNQSEQMADWIRQRSGGEEP